MKQQIDLLVLASEDWITLVICNHKIILALTLNLMVITPPIETSYENFIKALRWLGNIIKRSKNDDGFMQSFI